MTETTDWDDGFDAGYRAALELAVTICNDRAAKHGKRSTRLALDYQSEANACAFAIRRAADQKTRSHAKALERANPGRVLSPRRAMALFLGRADD